MKKYLLILGLLMSCFAHASTWTLVQLNPSGVVGVNGFCSRNADTCLYDLTAQAGGAIISSANALTFFFQDNLDSGGSPQRTLISVMDCDAAHVVGTPPSGSCSNSINTWTHGKTGTPTACESYANGGVNSQSTDCYTAYPSISGGRYIYFQRNTHSLNERWGGTLFEGSLSGASPVEDDMQVSSQNTNSNVHTMVTTSPTGNDIIFQAFVSPAGPCSITSPYSSNYNAQAHFEGTASLNTSDGTAPTQTCTGTSSSQAGSAVAWSDGAALAPAPVCTPGGGTYSTAQTVTCTDIAPVMCSATSGTPKTNGVSGCTIGTLVTGSFFIPLSQTLNVVAGGTGFADSSLTSNVYTINAPYVSLAPASLTFASQAVGSTSSLQSVTITNVGGAGLLIASIAISGDFAQVNTCPNSSTPLLAGTSCAISVTFTPTTTGARTGILTITDNSTGVGGTIQTAALSGTGASAPNPGITLNCAGRCSFIGNITLQSSPGAIPSGPPLIYAARTDGAVFGTGTCAGATPCPGELLPSACMGVPSCLANAFNSGALPGHQGAAMSYVGGQSAAPPAAGTSISGLNINGLNSYLVGLNTHITDPDFNTQIVRATDSTLGNGGANQVTCLGGGNFGISFHGVGAGTALVWSVADTTQANQYKIRINNSGGGRSVIAFNPTSMTVTPSDMCGNYFPGASSFSGTDSHVVYTLNGGNQENTVLFSSTTGTFVTPEVVTQTGTGSTAQILAVNSTFVQLGPASGSPNGTGVWTGSTSGAKFTPNSSTPGTSVTSPFASTIYKGIICDGAATDPDESVCQKNPAGGTCLVNDTNPACWYVYWTLVFNFNYLPSMVGDPHFPAADDCLPQNFVSIYTGVFAPSNDGTVFTQVFGDNGQNNNTGYNGGGNAATDKGYFCPGSPDNTCQGPVYASSYKLGSGCRVFNAMTDQITGDWGATGQSLDQQAFDIPGTLSTSPAPTLGDAWTQDVTNATTQLTCTSAATAGSCSQLSGAGAYVGYVYGGNAVSCANSGADATHVWRDTNGGSLTPSGCPVMAPYLYPDVLHDMAQSPNAQVSTFSGVQTNSMNVSDSGATSAISYNATTHLTTILWNNNTVYSPGQQFNFVNLIGSNVAYMNCTSANHCPVFTAVVVPNTGNAVCPGNGPYCPSGAVCGSGVTYCPSGSGAIVVTDNLGGPSNYTQSQTQTGCGKTCPTMYPHPQDESLANGGFGGTNFWQPQTLLVSADLRSTGHKAAGASHIYQGKHYTTINEFSPWLPATVSNSGSSNPNCQIDGSPCGSTYPGPLTPAPNTSNVTLIPFSITDDQHGDMECGYGSNDLCPPILSTALVCGQATSGGVGGFACPATYASLWDDEIIAAENGATRSSAGNAVGLDCVYDSTGLAVPCIYRLMHSYISGSHYALTVQNAEGSMSSDGLYYIWPSDWNLTLGCMDVTTTICWSSWEATAPTATSSSTSWSVDGSGNVTINMGNFFCPTNGVQYYLTEGTLQTIACGPTAGTVTLSGFTSASWLNGTFTLGANPNPPNPWGCNSGAGTVGLCPLFIGTNSVSAAHASTSGVESGGAQKAVPTSCSSGIPCQRADVWIAKLQSAHQ